MDKKIYLENGYLDFEKIVNFGYPFTFIVGGRGTGKTYGALKYLKENNKKFIFMRRTQTQLDITTQEEFSPWKTLNRDFGWNVQPVSVTKYNKAYYDMEKDDDGKYRPFGIPLGYTGALSTFSNLRGFDTSEVEAILYDEFIPEKHESKIKNEGEALFNAYETVNRNRELNGKKPVQLICLANANSIDNPVFMSLGLLTKADSMKRKGQEISFMKERGICLIILNESKISKEKADTALYRATKGTDFVEMSLGNNFSTIERSRNGAKNIKEYKPICAVGEIVIYKHKSNGEYYCTTFLTGSPEAFTSGDVDLKRFKRKYAWLWREHMRNNIVFESYLCNVLFEKYIE